jgi:Mn-containing catalase
MTPPIPKFDATKYPEVKRLMDEGVHGKRHHRRVDSSQMGRHPPGNSPLTDVEELLKATDEPPAGFHVRIMPERSEEFAPGLTPELMQLIEETAALR